MRKLGLLLLITIVFIGCKTTSKKEKEEVSVEKKYPDAIANV